jgi:hypothetical protein
MKLPFFGEHAGEENTPRQWAGSAAHLRRLDRADAGQLLGVRDEVYGLHEAA